MTQHIQRFVALFTILILFLTLTSPPVIYAETPTFRYIQVNLTEEEIHMLDEASLVYEGITYYGARESANVWRFMIDVATVDDSLIDLITLYNSKGVPYTFTPTAITDSYSAQIEELPAIEEPSVVEEPPAVEELTDSEDVTPVSEEAAPEPILPVLSIEAGNIAGVDRAVVGGDISYTFIVENTGNTPLMVTNLSHEYFNGDLDHLYVESFNENMFTRLYELIGEDGLLPGEQVEVTDHLSIPDDYAFDNHPEISSVLRVTGVDEYDRIVTAESQQIVLLQQPDFTVSGTRELATVQPGEPVRYTYTVTNTSNVTLFLADVTLTWPSGALTYEEQQIANERFMKQVQSIPEFINGFGPEEVVTFSFELPLLPSYDVRAGAELVQQATFTLYVNEGVNVTHSIDVPVAVKQPIPSIENEGKEEVQMHQQEVETKIQPAKTIVRESGAPPIELVDEVDTYSQDLLPMTRKAEETWHTMLGILLFSSGLLLLIRRKHLSTKR